MLKKKMLIALGVAAVLSVSCVSVTVWAEENAEAHLACQIPSVTARLVRATAFP